MNKVFIKIKNSLKYLSNLFHKLFVCFSKLSFKKKVIYSLCVIILVLSIFVGIPTLGRIFSNDNGSYVYWDGTTASSFAGGSGTSSDPYQISNAMQLQKVNSYSSSSSTKYFVLTSNIYYNPGYFDYDITNDKILYYYNSHKYYIPKYSTNYYSDSACTQLVGSVRASGTINLGKNQLLGNGYGIYGLFQNNSSNSNISFITEIDSGVIYNVGFINYLMYGSSNVSIIDELIDQSYAGGLMFNGCLISNPSASISSSWNDEDYDDTYHAAPIHYVDDLGRLSASISIGKIVSAGGAYGLVCGSDGTSSSSWTSNYYACSVEATIKGGIVGVGLVGFVWNTTIITKCIVSSNITAGEYGSGFVFYDIGTSSSYLTFTSCYNDATINCTGSYPARFVSYGYAAPSGSNNKSRYTTPSYDYNGDSGHGNNLTSRNTATAPSYSLFTSTMGYGVFTGTYTDDDHLWLVPSSTSDHNGVPYLYYQDVTAPSVSISVNNTTYSSLVSSRTTVTISDIFSFTASASDTTGTNIMSTDLKYIAYYLNTANSTTSLDVSSIDWNIYSGAINITEPGSYTLYAKTEDLFGNVAYASTNLYLCQNPSFTFDFLVNDYESGTSLTTYNNQITKSTRAKFNFNKNTSFTINPFSSSYTFNLNFSNPIPSNVLITMFDNINNKVYYYTTSVMTYNIPLSSFIENGVELNTLYSLNPINYYDISTDVVNINFDFVFDFSNASISSNYSSDISLQVLNDNTIVDDTSTTDNNTLNVIVYDSSNNLITSGITLTTTYSSTIDFSSTSSNTVPMTVTASFPTYNSYQVFDTGVYNRNYYLDITFNDSSNNIVTGNSINNVTFSLNGNNYYSTDSGHVKIPLSTLTNNSVYVTPAYAVNTILNGNYTLKFKAVCSDCPSSVSSNTVSVNVSVNNATTNIDCDFNVKTPENDRVILKNENKTNNGTTTANYKIRYDGELSNPKVLVSLYKKSSYTSASQTYDIVDLNTLLNTTLTSSSVTNKYVLLSSLSSYSTNATLNLKCNSFDIGGYKLVFDLYDGTSLVKSVEKTIIVK